MSSVEADATVWPAQRRTVGTLALVQVVGGIGNGAGLAVGALLIEDVSGAAGWAGMAVVAPSGPCASAR